MNKPEKLIENQIKKKRNDVLVKTIIIAKKIKGWRKVAEILSGSRRNRPHKNLNEINEVGKEGETIVIPGKVLSQGEITKKMRIIALNFSEKAKEKLLKKGSEILTIQEEIKKNPDGKGIKILK